MTFDEGRSPVRVWVTAALPRRCFESIPAIFLKLVIGDLRLFSWRGANPFIKNCHENNCAEGTLECGSSSYRLAFFPPCAFAE